VIRLNDVHAIRLIASAAHIQFVPKLHQCIAEYDSNDILRGGVLFTDWMGGSVQVHVAGFRSNWATKALLFMTFDYPFKQLKVKKLIGLVPEENYRARNLNLHLGFKIEYKIDDVFNDKGPFNGMYIMSMKREDCRWLGMEPPTLNFAPIELTNNIEHQLSIVDIATQTLH
jgi:hypothetical protein